MQKILGASKDKIYLWIKECGLKGRKKKTNSHKYSFDTKYFNIIDTQEKAYWLGFLWCDGYLLRRDREGNGYFSYEVKLSLAKEDEEHLRKFKNSLKSNHEIKEYVLNGKGTFDNAQNECRLLLANRDFGENLYENYGMMPRRTSINKMIERIPQNLYRHFIRGIMDADGSIVVGYVNDSRRKNPILKSNIRFSTYEELCYFIIDHLKNEKLTEVERQLTDRHKERITYCKNLDFSGNLQVKRILNYLYNDVNIYLERKHQKYQLLLNLTSEEK